MVVTLDKARKIFGEKLASWRLKLCSKNLTNRRFVKFKLLRGKLSKKSLNSTRIKILNLLKKTL